MSDVLKEETHYLELVARLEELTRLGKNAEVRSHLGKLRWSRIPRTVAVRLAEIARRIDSPLLSLHIMSPIIRSETELSQPPTNQEQLIYVSALINIGAFQEASVILDSLDAVGNPEVLLYKSFAQFGQWKYMEAIPFLQRFIRSKGVTEYRKVVGKVNLLAAYISCENYIEAEQLIDDLLDVTVKNNYKLLEGNTRELAAQLYIFTGVLDKAAVELGLAEACLSDTKGLYLLFVKKWKAILKLLQVGGKKSVIDEMMGLRIEALEGGHWETLRDLDFFMAMAGLAERSLEEVLFGTPYKSYKARAEKILKKEILVPKTIALGCKDQALALKIFYLFDSKVYDVRHRKTETIRIPKSIFSFIQILSKDFYKPFSIGALFSRLYPDEYFNPKFSVKKIDNLTMRTRILFKRYDLPIEVRVERGQYSLWVDPSIQLILSSKGTLVEQNDVLLKSLHERFGEKSFSSAEAASYLDLSKRTVHKILTWAEKSSRITVSGKGPSVRYRFSNRKVSRAA